MTEPIPPDPDSVEKWRNLPQNKPSSKAMSPVMGGGAQLTKFLLLAFILLMLGYLFFRG